MAYLFTVSGLIQRRKEPIISITRTSNCCFNHAIGLPRRNNRLDPQCDYEKMLYHRLQQYKHIWIKKATGLGITEFMLRYMAWLFLNDDTYRSAQMPIVCGLIRISRLNSSSELRICLNLLEYCLTLKRLLSIELNGCTIEAFPSNQLTNILTLSRLLCDW